MTPRHLLRTIDSLGGGASEDSLLAIVDPDNRSAVVELLRGMEADGLVESEVTITYSVTDAGRRDLRTPFPTEAS